MGELWFSLILVFLTLGLARGLGEVTSCTVADIFPAFGGSLTEKTPSTVGGVGAVVVILTAGEGVDGHFVVVGELDRLSSFLL